MSIRIMEFCLAIGLIGAGAGCSARNPVRVLIPVECLTGPVVMTRCDPDGKVCRAATFKHKAGCEIISINGGRK